MSDKTIKKVDKKALDAVRRLIEEEINYTEKREVLNLTEIFSGENEKKINELSIGVNKKKLIVNRFIRSQIQSVIKLELKTWLNKSLNDIMTPLIKEYLINSGKKIKNTSSKNKENIVKSRNQTKNKNILNTTKKTIIKKTYNKEKPLIDKNKFLENMSIQDLHKEFIKKGIKLDRRKKRDTLIAEIKAKS